MSTHRLDRKLVGFFLIGVIVGGIAGTFLTIQFTGRSQKMWVWMHILLIDLGSPDEPYPTSGKIMKDSEPRDYLEASFSRALVSRGMHPFRVQLTYSLTGELTSVTVLPQCLEGYTVQLHMSDEATVQDNMTIDAHIVYAPLCVTERHWSMFPPYAEMELAGMG